MRALFAGPPAAALALASGGMPKPLVVILAEEKFVALQFEHSWGAIRTW